jgi:hypothetical protein
MSSASQAKRLSGAIAIALAFVPLEGCEERAPSVDILGSFFPIWIFCIVAGIVFASLMRLAFLRLKIEQDVGPSLVIYPSLACFFAFSTWLIFFR